MASPYLNITDVTAGQDSKEITINDARLAVEQATQRGLSVDMSGGDVTLTVTQFTRNGLFTVSGPTADRTLTVPTNMGAGANTGRRMFMVSNPSTHKITVKTSAGTGYKIPATMNAALYMDGTNVIGLISGSADTRRHDLSFFFPGPVLADSLMVQYIFTQDAHWNVSIPGSKASCVFAPSGGDTQFIIKKNGFVIGAVDFAENATTATFEHPTATDWAPGDILEISTDPDDVFGIESIAVSIVGYLT